MFLNAFKIKYIIKNNAKQIWGALMMKFKFICCEVFTREACIAIARSPHTVDPEFTPKGAHEKPEYLRNLIQEKIDAADKDAAYDYVLLGFGLCGNAAAGLKARSIPLVIPRAHDCCTIFLGSRSRFVEYFGNNLSSEWSSAGYMERGDSYIRDTDTGKLLGLDREFEDLVEQYGEENAVYIWETLHPESKSNELIYINTPETSQLGYIEKLRQVAENEGKSLRILEGDMRLINSMVMGEWNEDEYLIVPPGKEIKPVYDMDKVVDI